jgi:hypothetical protein
MHSFMGLEGDEVIHRVLDITYAKAFGLTVLPTLLAAADEVIE